jgi:hypothetical protein
LLLDALPQSQSMTPGGNAERREDEVERPHDPKIDHQLKPARGRLLALE